MRPIASDDRKSRRPLSDAVMAMDERRTDQQQQGVLFGHSTGRVGLCRAAMKSTDRHRIWLDRADGDGYQICNGIMRAVSGFLAPTRTSTRRVRMAVRTRPCSAIRSSSASAMVWRRMLEDRGFFRPGFRVWRTDPESIRSVAQNHSAWAASFGLVWSSGVVRENERVIERFCSPSAAIASIG